jgi:hypothetical protein
VTDTHPALTLETLRRATFDDLTQSVLGSAPGMAREQAQHVAQKYIEHTFTTAAREELAERRGVARDGKVSSLLLLALAGGFMLPASVLGLLSVLADSSPMPMNRAALCTLGLGAGFVFSVGVIAIAAHRLRSVRGEQQKNGEATQRIKQGPEGLAVHPLSEEGYARAERTVKDKILALRQGVSMAL